MGSLNFSPQSPSQIQSCNTEISKRPQTKVTKPGARFVALETTERKRKRRAEDKVKLTKETTRTLKKYLVYEWGLVAEAHLKKTKASDSEVHWGVTKVCFLVLV